MIDPHAKPTGTMAEFDERRRSRRQTGIMVRVRDTSPTAHLGRMTDVSEFGCRITMEIQMVIGRVISIDVEGFTTFTGRVVWSSTNATGVDFSNPIRAEVVEHLGQLSGHGMK